MLSWLKGVDGPHEVGSGMGPVLIGHFRVPLDVHDRRRKL